MAASRPVFTENFATNLDGIRGFLGTAGRRAFARLCHRVFDEIVPTLCRFPRAGRPLLAADVRSTAARALIRKLRSRLRRGDDLREFIVDDYVLLYVVRGQRVVFLAIKHQRQLSFAFPRLWLEP
jgi:plasmid stabilization system protein ParE